MPRSEDDSAEGGRFRALEGMVQKLLARVEDLAKHGVGAPPRPERVGPRRLRTAGRVVRALTIRLTDDVDPVIRAHAERLGWSDGRVVNELLRSAIHQGLPDKLADG